MCFELRYWHAAARNRVLVAELDVGGIIIATHSGLRA